MPLTTPLIGARQTLKRVVLASGLAAAAAIVTLTASPALASESSFQPFTPASEISNPSFVRSVTTFQPGSDRMLNPQPLPPKQIQNRFFRFGR